MGTARSTIFRFTCAAAALLMLAACKKGNEAGTANQGNSNSAAGASSDTSGGSGTSGAENVALHKFTGNVQQAQAGRKLFIEYNCYSCHGGLAGGAMGPSLRDTTWKYGGSDQQIYASIHDGRPMGMPTWGKTLSDAQIKDLIQYIRSMRTPDEPKEFFITFTAGKTGGDTGSAAMKQQ